MKTFRSLIIDDELPGRENLKSLLRRHCPEIEIVGEAENAGSAVPLIEELKPDVLFLDILMPGSTGLDLLQGFPVRNFAVVFVTASLEFGIQAVKAGVLDYLLKPISVEELKATVHKIDAFLESLYTSSESNTPEVSRIALSHASGFTIEPIDNIIRLQADDNYTRVFTTSGKEFLVSRPLKDFERNLPDGVFVRIHKSYMINIHHLKDYSYEDGGMAILQDGKRIPVSKRKSSYFIHALKRFSLMLRS